MGGTIFHFSLKIGLKSTKTMRFCILHKPMGGSSPPPAPLLPGYVTVRNMTGRGGVEDTRLEAKAKDTKKSEAKAKDSFFEDRHSRGQGQKSRPRTQAQVPSKKKKKRSSQKFFRQSPQKNVFQKIFQALHKLLTIQKIVLSSSQGQAAFRGLEASRPRPRTSKSVLEDSTSDDWQRWSPRGRPWP